MGYYINYFNGIPLEPTSKAKQLLKHGATLAPQPLMFQEDLVCVVENGLFDAVGYAYNEEEMEAFARPDGRNKTWLIVPNAAELSGFNQ